MNYDLDKIRVACLELMGWRRETSQNWLDKQMDVIWIGPDGLERCEGLPLPNPIPEPTKSLDDALPLMEKYKITLAPPRLVLRRKKLVNLWTAESSGTVTEHEDAMVAVCLCALRIKHHDLKDFEIKPKRNTRKP